MRWHRRGIVMVALSLVPAMAGAQPVRPQGSVAAAEAESLYAAGNLAGAARAYEAALQRVPDDGRLRARLGMTLYRLGEFPRAAAAFLRAAETGVQPTVNRYNAASAYARAGLADSALAILEDLVRQGYAAERQIRGDSDFVALRGTPRFEAVLASAARNMRPCSDAPESHRFDFWVGEWDVTVGANGPPAGRSSVQKILEECVVFENWTGAGGGSGKSLNAFNRALGRWQQFWVDQFGAVSEYRDSEWKGTSLVLTARTAPPDTSAWLRMTFTPVDTNTVRQLGESSSDGGKSWTMRYDLYYHRRR